MGRGQNASKETGNAGFGLPFDSEPNILKHLARFLSPHIEGGGSLTHILFNGGQTKEPLIQEKILGALSRWFPDKKVTSLPLLEPEFAVSKGATAFGLAHLKIKGEKIRGGSPRSYFLEIAHASLEGKAGVMLVPSGFEFGQTATIDPQFLLKTNMPVQFTLYASSHKGNAGDILPLDEERFSLQGRLHGEVQSVGTKEIPVFLETHLTDIGVLELRARSKDSGKIYTFAFSLENKPQVKQSADFEKIDPDVLLRMKKILMDGLATPQKNLWPLLEAEALKERALWRVEMLRALFDALIQTEPSIRKKECARFWNYLGYFLRPGIGYALDQERIAKVWKIILQDGLASGEGELQQWIALRRIAAGLSKGQQQHLKTPLLKRLFEKNPERIEPKGRQEQYLTEELIRTLASLELIEIKDKVKLGNALLECIEKGTANRGYYTALGRIGARVPLFATIGSLLSKEIVEKWLERLLALKDQESLEWKFLLMQLTRKTPAEHLSISDTLLDKVKKRFDLESFSDDSSLAEIQEELIGDSLPLGITLL